jgi:hypothetical protein
MSGHSATQVQSLRHGLPALYEAALLLRQLSVAEHLLGALETLAQSEPECRALRDEAYLMLGRSDLDA